jgi:hypothetical protein
MHAKERAYGYSRRSRLIRACNACIGTSWDTAPAPTGGKQAGKSAVPQSTELIEVHKRRLGILEKQAAMHGALTPPNIIMEIEDAHPAQPRSVPTQRQSMAGMRRSRTLVEAVDCGPFCIDRVPP